MIRQLRLKLQSGCLIAVLAFAVQLTGCDQTNVAQKPVPVEGKRLDGATTALKPAEVSPVDPVPAKPLSPEEEKKKRNEWREKKAGKPDPSDPIAQANIELRPSLADPKTAANKTDPKPSDPTALAKPLTDPTVPAPFVDPNNPNFVPADRNLWKTFDIKKLRETDGFLIVPFADLSGFPYSGMVGAPEPKVAVKDGKEPAEPKKPEYSIPDAIKALNQKKVAIRGYMMPIDFEDGRTNEFVLTRQIPSCFYCIPPQLNDWVEIKMKDGLRVPYVPDGVIEVYGTLEVGELKEDGFIVNMYRMTGLKMVPMKAE